jgi:hypothetical protein
MILAEAATPLRNMAPNEPVKPGEFKADPETESALREDNLEEFLSLLTRL